MRLRRLTVVFCTYLFSVSCVIGLKSAALNPSNDVWTDVIKRLNEGDSPGEDVGVDLLKRNENELKAIALACSEERPSLTNACHWSHVQELNQEMLRPFTQDDSPLNLKQITLAQNIIDAVEANPVTSSQAVYDFEDGSQIGFCFGRALVIHHMLLKAGVKQEDMRKVFAVGELMFSNQMWNFHVAVMLRDAGGAWMVVDPLQQSPMPLSEWSAAVSSYDIKNPFPRVRYYIADVRKFVPGGGIYNREALAHVSLSAYFDKVAQTLVQ